MRLILFTHPSFMASQSMPRFARMLQQAYLERGHDVQLWAPPARLHARVPKGRLSKWAGYVDQYLLFPIWLRRQLAQVPPDTLFVMADQALGPWIPLLKKRPAVVHVHDLLALRSALGEVPENPTGFTGRVYQRYIRWGFSQARHFVCISGRTQADLLRVGGVMPKSCHIVYNGLNQVFAPMPLAQVREVLARTQVPAPEHGVLLHISGAQWYKNVPGVVRMYAHYARQQASPLPLWLVGVQPNEAVRAALAEVPASGEVRFLYGLDHPSLLAAYSLARAFLFPSLAEGFGWPIVEAQACGCPVITTNDSPMNEIGGPETRYLPLLRATDDAQAWAAHGAQVLTDLLAASPAEQARRSAACVAWSQRFDAGTAIDTYLRIYQQVLATEQTQHPAPATSAN